MTDPPGDPSLWQSGLRFADGTLKSDIYNNFRLPILVRQLGPGAVEVRGDARPGGAGTVVQIFQRGRKGPFKPLGGADHGPQRARLLRRALPDLAGPPCARSASPPAGYRAST